MSSDACKILPWKCEHIYQDAVYGKGNRVHNPAKPKESGKATAYRCTVCADTKEVSFAKD